jgi:FixJ family two-component response regulator
LNLPNCTICIIDDNEAIRESLRLLLFADGLSCCCFESADAFLEDGSCSKFDCMLLDIRMPGTDGLELFQILNKQPLSYPVIFITGHGDIPLAVSAIKQGAYDFLTKREHDVMRLLVRGLPNKGIAETLGISPRTVEIHRAHVMEKMQADSLPDLVRMSASLESNETDK